MTNATSAEGMFYIPDPYISPLDGCPICLVRRPFEEALANVIVASRAIGVALHEAVLSVREVYRVVYATNLGIWFAFEQYGMLKTAGARTQISAYEGYRARVGVAISYLEHLVETLNTANVTAPEEWTAFQTAYDVFREASPEFWSAMDRFTNARRKDAFAL